MASPANKNIPAASVSRPTAPSGPARLNQQSIAPNIAAHINPSTPVMHPMVTDRRVVPVTPIEAKRAEVEQLQRELNIERKPISITALDLVAHTLDHAHEDPMLTGRGDKQNPWAEKKKCNLV